MVSNQGPFNLVTWYLYLVPDTWYKKLGDIFSSMSPELEFNCDDVPPLAGIHKVQVIMIGIMNVS